MDGTPSACAGLIEAAWLAAAVVVPLIFHQHAIDGFQPYKATMVRLLAGVMVAAWGIRSCLDRRVVGADRLLPRPLMIALVAFLGAQLVATIFSINPRASFSIGSNSRGIVTALAEAVFFIGVGVFLRRRSQVDRLISALVATSIPVALYALIQRAGLDPIAFAGSEARVFSTVGHPIFLAAYLAMVLPLTWWKIAQQTTVAGRKRFWRLLFHVGVTVVQLGGFFCAQSRGPLIGLMAAAAFFGLGWAVLAGRWQRLWQVSAAICVGAALLVFLNLPFASSSAVARSLGLERFATTLGLKKGADPFRKAHWNAGVELMTSTQPILFPDGGSDRWHALRPWIGYGPETLANVLPQRYIWPGTDLKPESRFHNCVLDSWFALGALGALAFLGFFMLLFQHGMAEAVLGSRKSIFWLLPGLGIIGGGLFCAVAGKGFLGLGIVFGIATGCVLSVILSSRDRVEQPKAAETIQGRRLLPVALLAALVGHFVETGFAFDVPATSLLFWLYAGILLGLARVEDSLPEAASKSGEKGRKNRSPVRAVRSEMAWAEFCGVAYVPILVLVTLVYDFVQLYTVDFVDWTTVLGRTLTQIKGDQGPSHLVWLLFLPTWLATVFACAKMGGNRRREFWFPLGISAVVAGGFAIALAAQIAAIGPLPLVSDPPAIALSQIHGYQFSYFGFVVFILGLLLSGTWMLRSQTKSSEVGWRPVAGTALAIALGFAAVWFVTFREMHAEVTGGWGRALVSLGRLDAGTEVLQQTVREMPYSIFYRRELGSASIRRAQGAHDFETFDWLSRQSETALLPAASELHGMSTAGADLARLYLPWAVFTPPGERRLWLATQAGIYFERQQRFAPSHPVSWLDSAVLDEFLHHPEESNRKLQVALGLMDWRTGYWADAYCKLCVGCSAPELQQAYAMVVFRIYAAALQKARTPEEIALLHLGRAKLNSGLGHLDEARQECLEYQPSLAEGEKWRASAALAEIAWRSRALPEARREIDQAIQEAPPAEKPQLQNLKHSIEGR